MKGVLHASEPLERCFSVQCYCATSCSVEVDDQGRPTVVREIAEWPQTRAERTTTEQEAPHRDTHRRGLGLSARDSYLIAAHGPSSPSRVTRVTSAVIPKVQGGPRRNEASLLNFSRRNGDADFYSSISADTQRPPWTAQLCDGLLVARDKARKRGRVATTSLKQECGLLAGLLHWWVPFTDARHALRYQLESHATTVLASEAEYHLKILKRGKDEAAYSFPVFHLVFPR